MPQEIKKGLYVELPESLKNRVKGTAALHGMRQEQFVILALEHYLESIKNSGKEKVESIIEKGK